LVGALGPVSPRKGERAPVYGPGITVSRESDKAAEKQRRKDVAKNKAYHAHGALPAPRATGAGLSAEEFGKAAHNQSQRALV